MYYAVVNWYDDYNEEDKVNRMLILADSWNEAMQQITNEFQWINSIQMQGVVDGDKTKIIYIPEDCVDAIIKENSY